MILRRAIARLAAGLLSATLLLAAATGDRAHAEDGMPRIGFLGPGNQASLEPFMAAFRRGLGGHGYLEGVNIQIERRWAEDDAATAEAAAELAREPLRLIVAPTLAEVQAVHQANPTMPIVMVAVGDPVGLKLVSSLSHPGGVITGLTDYRSDFAPRRLSVLKQALPLLSKVGFLRDPRVSTAKQTEAAAAPLHLTLLPIDLTSAAELEPALAKLGGSGAEAVLVAPNPLTFTHRGQIAAFAAQHRLPTMFGYGDFMDVDGLMSYGADLEQLYVQAARYVRDILRGAKPGDLPILPPSKYEFIINLRNARDLGVTIPPALLAQADRLIE